MTHHHDDLAAQYTLAKRDFPDADPHRLIEIIRDRIGPDGETDLAAERLAAAPDVAFDSIEQFVWEMESDEDD